MACGCKDCKCDPCECVEKGCSCKKEAAMKAATGSSPTTYQTKMAVPEVMK